MKKYFILLLFTGIGKAHSQHISLFPERPQWKDSLRLKYIDTMGIYNRDTILYARLYTALTDGMQQQHTLILPKSSSGEFSAVFRVNAFVSAIKLELYSVNKEAENGTVIRSLYDPLTGKPMPGSNMAFSFFENPVAAFTADIREYPSHYLAYGRYFNLLSLQQPDDSKTVITRMVKQLEKKRSTIKYAPADLLSAICVGYAKTGRLKEAKQYLLQLLHDYPESGFTRFAFIYYDYEYYKAVDDKGDAEVLASCKWIMRHLSNAAISSDLGVLYHLRNDMTIPLSAFKKILLTQIATEPANYRYLELLVDIYIAKKEQLQEARSLLHNYIQQLPSGLLTHYYRIPAVRYHSALGKMYRQLAQINYLQHDYANALVFISGALQTFAETNDIGNYKNELLGLQANCYRFSGNTSMAMNTYQQLYAEGVAGAVDSMRILFPQYYTEGSKLFEVYLKELDQKNNKKKEGGFQAPDFTLTDLSGKAVNLRSLSGSIVVLNFWSIGCGPCIKEMPQLNSLADRYKQDTTVRFLALTYHSAQELNTFFAKRRFDYRVLADAHPVFKDYSIDAQPIHMVIGRDGKIVTKIKGTQENIIQMLTEAIERSR